MIGKLLKTTSIFLIILGTGLLAIATLTGAFTAEASIIQKHVDYINGWQWTYYTIDLAAYKNNLEGSINILNFSNIIPNTPQLPTWPQLSSEATELLANIVKILKYIAKVLITIPNFTIFIFNILLMPIKIIFYPVRILLALLGLNTSQAEAIQVFNTINTIFIPYIPINF